MFLGTNYFIIVSISHYVAYLTFFEKRSYIIVGFFIPVSSLEVFGHSIHSERRRICLGKSMQALQNDIIIVS